MYSFARRSAGRITPTRKLVKKGSSLRDLRPLTERVVLEKVLGVNAGNGNSGLTCNPVSGDIAYAAGCVIVIIGSPPQSQSHIINVSRKTVSSLAFSPDGKFLVSGESGHEPAVRVWDAEDNAHPQISEMTKGHKHGVQSVAFSPNMKYVVSVGFQHDMLVNIWNWREGTTIACNKVSSKVSAISFSETGDYFVTVGVRLVKFWYIDSNNAKKAKKKIPLLGRPAILGEQRDNQFIDVACGVGVNSSATYTVTKSGLLCSFNEKRLLDKWVELRVTGAYSLTVSEQYIFCGCSEGIIRLFNSSSLEFIGRLPKPHCLGVDVAAGLDASHLLTKVENATYPDTVALALDPTNSKLTCIYNDHSIYIWDIKDIKKIGKVSSFLYHSSCVWGVEVYPEVSGNQQSSLPYGSFLTCSSDGTVRVWNIETGTHLVKNIYSKELTRILYTEKDLMCLKDTNKGKKRLDAEAKPGIRSLRICHRGQRLATGDRVGNIRIFDLTFMDELIKIEAHEAEVLCIEYSIPESGYNLVGSAGRDRLIHVFDCDNNYNLLQTIDDHSASITAIKFNVTESKDLRLISCAMDKSVIFRSLQKEPDLLFSRYTNVATKTTFYDMDIHPTCDYTVTAGQDRNLRVFDISSGKQIRSFKGSMGDDGIILKVLLDKTGFYAATSCSDKSLSLYDFEMGECVAGMVGHSEVVTGLQFTVDCTRLITVSGDGCIFVWKLPSAFSQNMSERLSDQESPEQILSPLTPLRRETYNVEKLSQVDGAAINGQDFKHVTPNGEPSPPEVDYRFSIGKLPLWAKKHIGNHENLETNVVSETVEMTTRTITGAAQPAGKWAERFNPVDLKIQSESPSSVAGESPEKRRFTVDNQPVSLHEHLDVLARTPLEKRCSDGSHHDDEMFFKDASVALKFLKQDLGSTDPDLPTTVNSSRGSDVYLETIETRTYVESSLVTSEQSEQLVADESEEESEIIYYPTEEDTSEIASNKRLPRNIESNQSSSEAPLNYTETNTATKPKISRDRAFQLLNQAEPRAVFKKRSIEDYLRSPSEGDGDIGYFEIRPGHSMDDLVIHEVELATLAARRRSQDMVDGSEKSYDVKMRQDSEDEKDLESQNTDSMLRDDADDKTAESLSDDEDLLTTEIIPRWDEPSVEPAPTVGKADVENDDENGEEFLQENFECLATSPIHTADEVFTFKDGPEAAPTEPLPFDRNNFHRTSISARFILRSKQSSLRSAANALPQNSQDGGIEEKNLELEKRKEELALTKRRLEALGFTSIDKRSKNVKNGDDDCRAGNETKMDTTQSKEAFPHSNSSNSQKLPTNDRKPELQTVSSFTPKDPPAIAHNHTRPSSLLKPPHNDSDATLPVEANHDAKSSLTLSPTQSKTESRISLTSPIRSNQTDPKSSPHSSPVVSPVKVVRSPKGTVISSFEITNIHHPTETAAKSPGSVVALSPNSKTSGHTTEDDLTCPTKRASQLIAFFDHQENPGATTNSAHCESVSGTLHSHEAHNNQDKIKTHGEIENHGKIKNQDKIANQDKIEPQSLKLQHTDNSVPEKLSKNSRPSKSTVVPKNGEKSDSRSRKSFLSNIRFTKSKGITRRGSKGELSTTKSSNDLLQEQMKEEATRIKQRRIPNATEPSGVKSGKTKVTIEEKPAVEKKNESKSQITPEKAVTSNGNVQRDRSTDSTVPLQSHTSLVPDSNVGVSNSTDFMINTTEASELSELTAELNAALATPQYEPIQINLSRDYLRDGNHLITSFSKPASEMKSELSSQITKEECREVVVDLVRSFERAMECHSKILQGDLTDDHQQQALSMLSATFSTIQESVQECKRDRELKTRSTRSTDQKPTNTTTTESNPTITDTSTQDATQQTEQSFLQVEDENLIMVPLLEKYSELLLQKIQHKLNNN